MGEITWDEGAEAKLERVPVFVRGMVKSKIEKAAAAEGIETITAEFVDKIREESGG